jgi:hypothetical protein
MTIDLKLIFPRGKQFELYLTYLQNNKQLRHFYFGEAAQHKINNRNLDRRKVAFDGYRTRNN